MDKQSIWMCVLYVMAGFLAPLAAKSLMGLVACLGIFSITSGTFIPGINLVSQYHISN